MRLSLIGVGLIWLAASSWAWSVQQETDQLVSLRGRVEVDHETILLSDLLPLDAPSALKRASAAIQLGRAPKLGSIRTLVPEQIAHQMAADPTLLAVFRLPPRITICRFEWPINSAAVRRAISVFLREKKSKYGDLISTADLQLDNIGALEENPALVVTAMEWDDRRQVLQFRLRCANRAWCGNFLVYAGWPPALTAKWRARFRSALPPSAPSPAVNGSLPGQALAEIGKPAILILEGSGLRISVPVLCLGRGVLHQQIRVLDARTHRVFAAEVVGTGLLHASL